MRKLNIMSLTMSLLSMLFIFSVGFSSWIVVKPPVNNTSGSFAAYPVEYMSEYISTTKDDIDIFQYSALHFWNDSKTAAADSATITIQYTIDLAKCKAAIGEEWNGSLSVQTNLWYENVRELDGYDSLFSTINTGGYSRSVSVAIEGQTPSVSNAGDMITVSNTFTSLGDSGTYTFKVVYTFNIPENKPGTETSSNFRYCFGKYLMAKTDDHTTFHTSAKVTTLE